MKKLIFIFAIISVMSGCEKSTDKISSEYTARIVGFDLNCSTCILEFPDAYSQVRKEIGDSPDNYYQTINLSKGNYEIGQKVRVKIRKAYANELTSCITMNPTYNYQNVFITEADNFNDLIFNDTIKISYQDCLYDPEDQMYICLDSVLSDSRCPIGANCFWEGNAEVRFKFEKFNENPILFNLNTNMQFPNGTIVEGYKFTLIGLTPYPSLKQRTAQKDYKAEILVEKN